jgi:hypothetical protein
MPAPTLAALEHLRLEFGGEAAARKLALLKHFARARLGNARAVKRLHEALCFIRAYPDNRKVLALTRAMLAAFPDRADLRAHRAELADTGIAGTRIHYRFFAGQAHWLAENWPGHLHLDRDDEEADARLARALLPLLTHAEATAIYELKKPGYAALDHLRHPDENDAVFLLRRVAAMPGNGFTRENFVDTLDASFVLGPGPGTPSRTMAELPGAPIVFRREPLPRGRPDLRAETARPPRSTRRITGTKARQAIDLARAAMVTRERSLEAFSFANARDVWLVDDGDGLAFAFMGIVPERRHALAAYYGGLTLRNGVPIGYHQVDFVGASAALSFNAFETFRGGEAAFTFARWLAALRHVFGATSFTVEPYQLGKDNDEGLESGAWWFYAKLGFLPRHERTLALAQAELARVKRNPRHRTSLATLRKLAERHVFLDLEAPRPFLRFAALGLHSGAQLSKRAGADRERAVDHASADLMRHCGIASLKGFTPDEREAWRRLAPILSLIDLGRWREDERRALVEVIRAKGGRSERDFLARYRAHPRLGAAMLAWARAHPD